MRGLTGVQEYQTAVGVVGSWGLDCGIFRGVIPLLGFSHALELDNHQAYRRQSSVGDFDVGTATNNLAAVLRQRRTGGLLVGGEFFGVPNA